MSLDPSHESPGIEPTVRLLAWEGIKTWKPIRPALKLTNRRVALSFAALESHTGTSTRSDRTHVTHGNTAADRSRSWPESFGSSDAMCPCCSTETAIYWPVTRATRHASSWG